MWQKSSNGAFLQTNSPNGVLLKLIPGRCNFSTWRPCMAPPPLALPRRSCHVALETPVAVARCPSAYVARDAQGALARSARESEDASQTGILALQQGQGAECCSSLLQLQEAGAGNAIGAYGLRLQVERAITKSDLLLLYAVLVHCIATRCPQPSSSLLPCFLWLLPCFLCLFGFCCL